MAVPYHHGDTIIAQATPPGTSALGIVRLSGKDAITICGSVFRGNDLTAHPGYTLHYGHITDGESIVDEVVVGLFRNPRSYTGEDMAEISCHGSPYVIERIIALMAAKGARLAEPGEFTLRAFLNGKMDLTQAEAVADLIAASNASAHQAALRQLKGGFANQIKQLREELIRFAALIELELDFSEEDVELANRGKLLELIAQLRGQLAGLIESFELGNAIKNGVATVIAGRPNAGKSTLLNALLNEERAIVSEIPGTTRDTVEEVLHISGIPFRLIDTAGLRDATDRIEAMGVERTMEKIRTSAVVVYVFDSTTWVQAEVQRDVASFPGKVILAANKTDLARHNGMFDNAIAISAKMGQNLDALRQALLQSVITDMSMLDNPIVTSQRHAQALRRADEALSKVESSVREKAGGEVLALDVRVALNALGEITGEITSETLLQSIFERFCIGK